MTPMMEQYFEVKNQYKDYILFYRLGDFYEMFFEDAKTASRVLGLTLTGRDCGEEERAPMCGVPFHSSEGYIGELIEKGYKVAICEQMEDPSLAKGLVSREVIRVVTPGTVIESDLLKDKENNYLCTVCLEESSVGLAFADVSTAQVYATGFSGKDFRSALINELGTYAPREVLVNVPEDKCTDLSDFVRGRLAAMLSCGQGVRFAYLPALESVKRQFGERVDADVLKDHALISALGALLDYIRETQKKDISYIKDIHFYSRGQYMELDVNTRRNLELTETMRAKERKGSLLGVLDKTRTAAGGRELRQWIEHPLLDVPAIRRRQSAVEELFDDYMMREELGDLLSDVLDLERLITRIVYGTANAKDLRAVANTIHVLPEVKQLLGKCKSQELCRISSQMDTLEDLYDCIDQAIVKDPPFSVREGGMIADGYNEEVDKLRSIMANGKEYVEKMAEEERERTGIKNLRIGFNKVFGYYIEVTKSNVSQVPEDYIRKQTLTGAERYITQDLKNMESTILGAKDRVCSYEYELFSQIRTHIAQNSARIQTAAALLAVTDVYQSLATVASRNHYVCPDVGLDDRIEVTDGRHPVVEQFVKDSYFVPNDVFLDTADNRLLLITGPNMAGKSTFMRQVALITVMAQIGSFVPAKTAHIGVADKVFTRVGASDDLASGQSTFMLEMNEVAYILKNATKRSLIIYDEVGRGTSTFDGMSIARAIAEYTWGKRIGARTLFATHYHELTVMENEFRGIVNYNVAARKRGDNITFLRKIVRGSTDDSYGIEVAKLAGLPGDVIKRAKEVLAGVEQTARAISTSDAANILPEKENDNIRFEDVMQDQVIEDLKNADLNTFSPYEAMSFLFDLQKRLK